MYKDSNIAQTMMDEDYAQEAIRHIESLEETKAIDEYARYLISNAYIKDNGFKLSPPEWSTDIYVDDARMQSYRDKVKPFENYLDNCLEIVLYLVENTNCDAKLVVDYLEHALQWEIGFENIDNHTNLLDEKTPNQYAVKIDRVIKKICEKDESYEELLSEIYEWVGIVTFTKIKYFVIKIENEKNDLIKGIWNFQQQISHLESESKNIMGIHVVLGNEIRPYRKIEIDLRLMENKSYGEKEFASNLIKYLNKVDIDSLWTDDIVIFGYLDMHHFTIELDKLE